MNQLPNGIASSFVAVVLCILLTLPLLAFFFIAIFSQGMRWMSFFTMLIGGISAMFVLLLLLGIDLTAMLPVRVVPSSGVALRWLAALVSLAAFTLVFIHALTERDIRAIIFTWLIILLFNAGDMLYNAWLWLTWVQHVARPHRQQFLYRMIYPSFWIPISVFCLIKTIKEKLRIYLAAARQQQAPGPVRETKKQ